MGSSALKGLERAVKRRALAAAARLAPRASAPPDWTSRPHRVLYLRYDRIGDMIMATGLIRVIATGAPGTLVDVLASPANLPVLAGNPHVARALAFDRRSVRSFARTVRTMRRQRYDAVIAGMIVPSATTMALMVASGAPHRIGIAAGRENNVYTIAIPPAAADRPFVEQIGQLVSAFGLDPEQQDWHYDLFLNEQETSEAESLWRRHHGSPRILVNVSAAKLARRWPADRYATVVRHIRERHPGASVLVTGDPREWHVAREVAAAGGAATAETAHVREAFALVATADALVTPDTSLAHAAAATNTPAAVLISGLRTIDAPSGDHIVRVVSPGVLGELDVRAAIAGVDQLLALVAR